MSKIEKLTKEQEERFPEFVEKWTRIGLSTAPLNRKAIEAALKRTFAQVNKPPPKLIICTSPLAACLTRGVLASVSDSVSDSVSSSVRASISDSISDSVSASVSDSVRASVSDSVRSSVRSSVRDSVSSSVLASVRASVSDSVRASVSDSVRSSVRASISDSVSDSVRASVRASVSDSVSDSVSSSVRASISDSVSDSVRASVLASVSASVRSSVSASVLASVRSSVRASVLASVDNYWYCGFGQYESYWLAFYDFMRRVLGVDNSLLGGNEQICHEAGWSILFWNLAFVSEKPAFIYRDERGRLHRDQSACLQHSDGWSIYALHGIRMKPEYVLTPAEQITPEAVLAETNADQRRELIRKVGVERMLSKLPNKSLHKRGNYELLSVRLSEQVSDARYLRMLNPSVGVWHLEGVPSECKTVEESLNWRNNQWHVNAEVLT